jgi:4-diphosphocytidyl-2-C-methyl-D-erythritol kinase
MSGSGPTVFGFFDNEEKAKRARVELLENYSQVYVVTSSEKGVEIYG